MLFKLVDSNQRSCILVYCIINCVEDDFHFILICPFYTFCKKFIKLFFWIRPSMFKVVQPLISKIVKIMNNFESI